MNKQGKIIFGLLGIIATGGLIFLFNKSDKKEIQKSFSGCDGLSGNESTDNMCNHLSLEHGKAEKEIVKILQSANSGNNYCTKDVVDIWDKEINHHFQEEENVVFPKILKSNIALKPIIDDLLNDHKFFYSAISEMKRVGNCQNLSVMFCDKLLNHIEKEERLFTLV